MTDQELRQLEQRVRDGARLSDEELRQLGQQMREDKTAENVFYVYVTRFVQEVLQKVGVEPLQEIEVVCSVSLESVLKDNERITSVDTRSLHAWIYAIANRDGVDWVRGEKRQDSARQKLSEYEYLLKKRAESRQVDVAKSCELRELTENLLAVLNPRDREIAKLRFLDGLTLQEMAEQLGVTTSTISEKIQRIIQKLQQYASDRGLSMD